MNPISLAEIRRVTGASDAPDIPSGRARTTPHFPPLPVLRGRAGVGVLGDSVPARLQIAAVCTDTRNMAARSLFIALRGDRFDAHDFLHQAHARGAAAALVDHLPANPPAGLPLLQVPDTRAALGLLARRVRQLFRGKVIAVAGSNGKTGTKHLIHSALRETLRGSMSPKSFNNDIGVPLAIFPADPADDYLVLELGTNHPGEIRNLTQIAQPDIAIITNCSAEHLQGLGDLDGVRRENASLIDALQPDGTLIINGDDPALLQAVSAFHGDCLTFGFSKTNDLWASNPTCSWNGTHFTIQPGDIEAFVPLLGNHVAANALAAVAVARRLGLSDSQIVQNLAKSTGPEMRLEPIEADGVRILNDAYNANPASMMAAIQTLASLPARGRRIAVLGDMRKLGDASAESHRQIGRFLADKFRPDLLICVGAECAQDRLGSDPARHACQSHPAVPRCRRRRGILIPFRVRRSGAAERIARHRPGGRRQRDSRIPVLASYRFLMP